MVFFWYIFKKSKTLTKNDSNILFSKSIRLFCNEIFSNILIICSTHEISSTEAIVFIIDEIALIFFKIVTKLGLISII